MKEMVESGIAEEDIGSVISHFERWARYESLFSFVEVLESSWSGLSRLMDELGFTGDDTQAILDTLKIAWGLARFTQDGEFVEPILVSHEGIGPDSFFEGY